MADISIKIGESKTVQLFTEQSTRNGVGVGQVTNEVTWETSDEDVAAVVTGLSMGEGSATSAAQITGVWLGTATITATSADGKVDTITVSVTEADPGVVRIGVPS